MGVIPVKMLVTSPMIPLNQDAAPLNQDAIAPLNRDAIVDPYLKQNG